MLTCHSIIIAAGCQGVFENVSSSYKIKIQFIPQAKDRPTVRNFTETLRFFFFFFFSLAYKAFRQKACSKNLWNASISNHICAEEKLKKTSLYL